jgi:hypothetical protein
MRHAIPHDLGLELACQTTRAACDHYCVRFAHYHPVVQWQTQRQAHVAFAAKGLKLSGDLEVTERELVLELLVPLLLRPLQKRAVEIVEREFRGWLERARADKQA